VSAPRLTLPPAAEEACQLPLLPDDATQGDLDATYIQRGAALAICEGKRQLAVDTLKAERDLIDRWTNPAPWWAVWRR